MKIKLKTLKGLVIELETPPDTVVQKVKEMGAASEHGKAEGWDPEGMKLIYQGKMLENSKDLASYSIKEVPAAPPAPKVAAGIAAHAPVASPLGLSSLAPCGVAG